VSAPMAPTMKLEIVTPEKVAFAEDVSMVTLPAIDGQIGIYPQHVRLITQMAPGELSAITEGGEILLAVGEGLVVVTADRVQILTDMAMRAEEIDEARVEEERRRAAARLQEKISEESLAAVNATVIRALAQLQVRRRRPTAPGPS
jgi:F-type H+-transporting ATPase subunit epsilon